MKSNDLKKEAKKLLVYLKEDAQAYKEDLSKEEKEKLAGYMVGAIGKSGFNYNLSDMQKAYPVFDTIDTLSSDLEWSNSSDIDEDWQKLLELIDEFDRQVNG